MFNRVDQKAKSGGAAGSPGRDPIDMLAYVFWHWPQPRIGREVYERRLIDFHDSLAANTPAGFHRSIVFRLRSAPGLGEQRGYEDWYLIDDFADLGALNSGAVSDSNAEPHDRIASLAAGGTAGIYRLCAGSPTFAGARWTAWLPKPAGMSYPDLLHDLAAWTARPGHALWQRQLTLGPGPEFALICPTQPDLPAELGALLVPLDPLRA